MTTLNQRLRRPFPVVLAITLTTGILSLAAENTATNATDTVPDWKARWELARTLSYAKRLDESVAQYTKLLAEKPDLAQAKAELATVLFWKGKADDALKLLEQVPAEAMTPEARLASADIHASKGDYAKAESLYREHLKAKPDADDVRLRLAETLSWAKRYDAAVAEYKIILGHRPDDIQVRRKYALVLSWIGDHAQAADELKKTLDQEGTPAK